MDCQINLNVKFTTVFRLVCAFLLQEKVHPGTFRLFELSPIFVQLLNHESQVYRTPGVIMRTQSCPTKAK